MNDRLKNKVALITGGTAGIGLETARQFQLAGAKVIVTGRSPKGIRRAQQYLDTSATVIPNDAACPGQQKRLAQQLSATVNKLDIVYLNAGDVTHLPLEEWDETSFDRVIATNLKGPFFLIQSLLPLLNNGASIILCGSASAHIGLAQSSIYAASKAGLISLARTLCAELKHRGIRVNVLSPGPTQTDAFDKFGLPAEQQAVLLEQVKQLVPLNRLGTPVEVAKAALFLASDDSSYMLGSELLVDGGVVNI
ncbi:MULTISPECIES: SDR family oxidoreductase [unclassified Vibrio]|uniref:SDR family oxidoreductase n=1 Tax=unclassified Vibrio TaxID=2614977 RepID=UPI0010A69BE3|nr:MULTISPECIES: SDR family oxidoreductase [unclassified Vibrio]WGY45972.1 SDR family oxidoreductase [Vibrio sp. ABG19]